MLWRSFQFCILNIIIPCLYFEIRKISKDNCVLTCKADKKDEPSDEGITSVCCAHCNAVQLHFTWIFWFTRDYNLGGGDWD